ncbi:MAG: lipoyl synthase [Acidimicrobiia bacterium]|nr:lipoyl synthase [Acidimicrobiia bacterium]
MSDRDDDVAPLAVRRLGRVPYLEALDLQTTLFERRVAGKDQDWLLLLEHPPVFTLGRNAEPAHVLTPREELEAAGIGVVETNRGGDVTYHGPGQLVAYPILDLGPAPDVVAHVRNLEEIVIRTLDDFGVPAFREEGYSGVWTERGKVAAVGCRITRGVTMHGTALNVAPDMGHWRHIVPCGLADRSVTSMRDFLGARVPTVETVGEAFARHAADVFARSPDPGLDITTEEPGAPARRGVPLRVAAVASGPDVRDQARTRPAWLRNRARLGDRGYMQIKAMMRDLDLNTVCEEAGCPNIFECWSERTATLMLLGRRCTRSCGFCEVDTRRPLPVDTEEPARVAEAVARMGLEHAVLTSVARDDLPDGGASVFAAAIDAIRALRPRCTVEVLVPDFKGDAGAAAAVFAASPDVFNHNIETVTRFQRLVRPQAGYARSLTLLARAGAAGLTTKSGIMLGLGETTAEVHATMRDLAAVGCSILTVGQYLRPSARHLPVRRWVEPAEFDELGELGRSLGFAYVEAGPMVRSSFHAARALGPPRPAQNACEAAQ